MKTNLPKIVLLSLFTFFSCKKTENGGNALDSTEIQNESSSYISDSVSSAASLQIKDKQFVKTADVNMEVKDVYESTVALEKIVKNLGGFVTSSRLNSEIVSENTYHISDENATLIRKFQTQNTMQVRVPTEKLAEFLTLINEQKVFLNSRTILAEDVTAAIKLAELEEKRAAKTSQNIAKIANNKDKVILSNENQSEANSQKVASFEMTDQLKYSTVDLFLKEPKVRVAEIAVTNTTNVDNKFKSNFYYEAKSALVAGFYLIQKIILGVLQIWPLLLIGGAAFYFYKRKKATAAIKHSEISE